MIKIEENMMLEPLTPTDIEHICRSMMKVDWLPSFIDIPSCLNYKNNLDMQNEILSILNQCQSELEVSYLLGIGYYLYSNNVRRNGPGESYPSFYPTQYEEQQGIHINEPFNGGLGGNGFSSLLVIPQYRTVECPLPHDFGFLIANDNAGGPPWYFYAAIEIEECGIYRGRRKSDQILSTNLSYKIISVHEETDQPKDWYKLFDPDVNEELLNEDEEGKYFY
jgi:hypothetical protein